MRRFIRTVLDNQSRHGAYRASYWRGQVANIFRMSCFFCCFSIFAFFLLAPIEHGEVLNLGRVKYGIGIFGDFFFLILSRWLLDTKKYTDDQKAIIAERVALVVGTVYLLWGILGMHISIVQGASPNVLMFIIMLAVLTAFYIFPGHHYFIMISISYIVAGAVFVGHKNHRLDVTSTICAVVAMILLFRLGRNRYIDGRNRFEAETENVELMVNLEDQNKKLLEINQALNETTEKLKNAYEDLQDKSEAQKRFTNSMNHELRAPLNGIIGMLQVELMKDLTEEQRNDAEQCMSLAKTLLNLVNELLDVAKMEAGQLEILPASFDFHDVVGNIKTLFEHSARMKELDFVIDIPNDMVCGLYGDDFRIQQIITNLVSNGIKYTDKGSVVFGADYDEGNLIITVSDTGQGMSPESIKDLFVPFKRINEGKNKNIQGTGLGMAIVDNLVKRMNGKITVNSVINKGTTFTVTIPAKIVDKDNRWGDGTAPERVEYGDETDTAHTKGYDFSGMRIMYVDDTMMNLKIITKLIEGTGAVIDTYSDPFEGYERAKNNEYDIILVDHQMPGMNGPEFLEKVKKESEANKSTPVIIFTGNAGTGLGERYKEMGFDGYMTKPILRDALLELIARYK